MKWQPELKQVPQELKQDRELNKLNRLNLNKNEKLIKKLNLIYRNEMINYL